jgi:plastocyanin
MATVRALGLLVLVLFAAACAATVTGQAAPPAAPGKAQQVTLDATSYAFRPNKIAIKAGQPVDLMVNNLSGTTHNLTVLNTKGFKVVDVDIPPHTTRKASFIPIEPGKYKFYCDTFFHDTLGMSGEFNAEGGS